MLGDTNNDEDLQSDNDDSDNDPHYVPVDQEDKGTCTNSCNYLNAVQTCTCIWLAGGSAWPTDLFLSI